RAIVREPAVFLMDEPLSNLDAKLRVATRAEIARLHQRLRTTIVYVTHDQVEAMTMGTRIAVMSAGLLQQVGPPQVLYDHPLNKFVAGFIGSPSMNFVDMQLDRDADRSIVRDGELSFPLPDRLRTEAGVTTGRALTVGFRPEHLDVGSPQGSGEAGFQVHCDVVEFLGNEELLHTTVGDHEVVALIDSANRVKPGDVLDLRVPLEKLHLFDRESGLALDAPPSTPVASPADTAAVAASA
ncbi:MAG: ABC transporter ATP-binding protein, partial [Candidatus Limnocylindrales bacterium]